MKSTIFRQHAFRDTFAGLRFPTVDSKVVVDEVQLCKKDKHRSINTAEFRVPFKDTSGVRRGDARYFRPEAVFEHILGKSGRSSSIPHPSGEERRKANPLYASLILELAFELEPCLPRTSGTPANLDEGVRFCSARIRRTRTHTKAVVEVPPLS